MFFASPLLEMNELGNRRPVHPMLIAARVSCSAGAASRVSSMNVVPTVSCGVIGSNGAGNAGSHIRQKLEVGWPTHFDARHRWRGGDDARDDSRRRAHRPRQFRTLANGVLGLAEAGLPPLGTAEPTGWPISA